jgi:hypothetical protein
VEIHTTSKDSYSGIIPMKMCTVSPILPRFCSLIKQSSKIRSNFRPFAASCDFCWDSGLCSIEERGNNRRGKRGNRAKVGACLENTRTLRSFPFPKSPSLPRLSRRRQASPKGLIVSPSRHFSESSLVPPQKKRPLHRLPNQATISCTLSRRSQRGGRRCRRRYSSKN